MIDQTLPMPQLELQRGRLVRLCATITGDPDVAEDLAQEALIAAWRHIETLRAPESLNGWLSGIARNLSLRWLRSTARPAELHIEQHGAAPVVEPVSDLDLELELERDELVELLDRALRLLPPASRELLVRRYVDEWPPAQVANGPDSHGLHVRCAYCAGPPPHENLYGLANCTPQARRFWQSHHRIRARPPRELETEGRAALAIVFEQVDSMAELGVLVDRETFRRLRIYQSRS